MAPGSIRALSGGQSPVSPRSNEFSMLPDKNLQIEVDSGNGMSYSHSIYHRRTGSMRQSRGSSTSISKVVSSLKHRSGDELGPAAISQVFNATHTSLLDWIRGQRLTLLPPEGSDYDKVLAWAQLFVERLHSFDLAVGQFEANSYQAAQLSYGYCAMLLELGRENASALTTSFGFFYGISMTLLNLLERSELFTVNHEISEQLVLALGDLVTLVASVSTLFHKAIHRASTAPVSIDIHRTFSTQIRTFCQRCEAVSISMWKHQLFQENVEGCGAAEINAINTWLTPADKIVAGVADSTSHLAHDREELTFLWAGPYLARFLKSSQLKNLAISGKPGAGKTVLASVIVDHLQHPIGGVSYSTIYVPINARIQAETSTSAVARAILCQLFAQRIGNIQLFQIVHDALKRSKLITDDDKYDDLMWKTLEKAISASLLSAKDLVLVVDGIDESACGEKALLARLVTATSKSSKVKLVTLGAEKPSPSERQAFVVVDKELIFDDICAVIRSQLKLNDAFSEMSEMNQETIVTRITDASGGSFLWSKLSAKSIRGESSADGLRKAVDNLVSSKPTVSDLVAKVIQKSTMSGDARHILLWLATVQRPLQIKELEALISVQVDKQTVNNNHNIDILQRLKPAASLVFLLNGLVYLRHGAIRTAILDVFEKGKLVPAVKDRHADITSRLLIYLKTKVTDERQVSVQPMDKHDALTLINQNVLLDFSLRYWPLHFKNTATFTKNRKDAAKQFLEILPASATTVLLQETIWTGLPTPVSHSYSSLTLGTLRDAFTVDHVATLQSTIVMAQLLQQLGKSHEASTLYYQAAMASHKLYTSRSQLTMQLTRTFLDITSGQVTSTKTNIMAMREECLVILVECYKFHYGETSETVVTIMRQLYEHYHLVKEVRKTQEIESKIQALTHSELVSSDDTTGSLAVKLRARSAQSPTDKTQTLNLDAEYDEKVETAARGEFSLSIKSAQTYTSTERHEMAERTYLECWMRETEEARISVSIAAEERKVKAMFEYCKFLKSQNRTDSVASILSSYWQDSQRNTASMNETSVGHFQNAAHMLHSIGLSTLALNIYESCLEYYKNTSHTHSTAYEQLRQTTQSLALELLESLDDSSAAACEVTLNRMVNEAIEPPETVNQTTFTAIDHLLKLYSTQHRWHDTTRLMKKALHSIWPSLFATSLDRVSLPGKHVSSCLNLADRLAQSYASRRRPSKEQEIRVRCYRALRSGRPVDNKARQQATAELLGFYESTSQTDLIIGVHQDLLQDYIDHYGPDDAEVVQKLWTLAELTRPQPIFITYYQQIIQILNKDSKTCRARAFEPAVVVATELWNQNRHTDAIHLYKLLFNSFIEQQSVDHRLKQEQFVQEVFTRYTHCLRVVKTDFTTLYKITTAYRKKCKATFGALASITVSATLTLARLCQESELHEKEAMELYEELSKIKSDVLNQREITAILNAYYEEQASAAFSNLRNDQVSNDQAVVIEKQLNSTRETYGWVHEKSLTQMKKIAVLHATHQRTEEAVTQISQATTHILSSTTSTTALATAASAIASSYIAVGQTEKAVELTDEVYRQVIMQDFSASSSFNLESKQQQGLVFLAQMKHSLSRSSTSVTEILASLTREHLYFQEFRRTIKSRSSTLHSVILSASSLYEFLKTSGRKDAASRVILDLKDWFIATEGQRIKWTDSQQIRIFLTTMMDYLRSYQVKDFTRSVGIAGNTRVVELLKEERFEEANTLAIACFKYMSAQKAYHTAGIVKFVFTLGMNISGRDIKSRVSESTRRKLLATSSLVLQDALGVVRQLDLDLALLEPEKLNNLIGVLGDHQDHQNLAWLLTILWNNREMQRNWKSNITLALGCRYIMARYLVGDTVAAVRLAEDVVYNCRRVHGARHSSTIEMSVLLSQLYTGIAQKYQSHKDGAELAKRYYKKSAFIHENILRAFIDPTIADVEMNLDSAMSMDSQSLDLDPSDDAVVDSGEHVREHFKLLKLAVERLGDWPKDYHEYEKLSGDLYREFPQALKGFDGVEKWNLKSFGGGKAESNDDQLDAHFNQWQLDDSRENSSGMFGLHVDGMASRSVGLVA